MRVTFLLPKPTRDCLTQYLNDLQEGSASPGKYLERILKEEPIRGLDEETLLDRIIQTKIPRIFAESEVEGDGSDWNPSELRVLGDLSVAVPVTVFDDGRHTSPTVHEKPFPATLVFTPGALLRNGRGKTPADWREVTTVDGELDHEGYNQLYERRLLPVFTYVEQQAKALGKQALVTLPGLGCGQFAGVFAGRLGAALRDALARFLELHGREFPSVKAVYYDPYSECANARRTIHGITFMVRPLLEEGNADNPQLCPPVSYEEEGDDFSDCELFSVVAWDHVSWPGNDFYAGSRCTDDGVKAAATDVMHGITGVAGWYDTSRHAYLPPAPCRTWGEVVADRGLRLRSS